MAGPGCQNKPPRSRKLPGTLTPVASVEGNKAAELSMTDRAKNIAVLGSTGSIGQSTLAVIAASQGGLAP